MPPYLGLVLGVAAVSSAAVIIRLAGEAPALTIGAYRLVIASLVVLPVAFAVARPDLSAYHQHSFRMACLSGLFLALHFGCWITSLDYTTVASSVVLVTTSPLMIAPFSRWLTGDPVSRRTVLGILIALAGTAVLAFGDGRFEADALAGNGLALLGAAAVAGHRITGRRQRPGGIPAGLCCGGLSCCRGCARAGRAGVRQPAGRFCAGHLRVSAAPGIAAPGHRPRAPQLGARPPAR